MGLYEYLIKHIDRKKEKKLKKQKAQKNNAETKDILRFKKLLHLYFDYNAKGLTPAEINEVNNYIKSEIVLNDEKEINSFTTLLLTYLTVAKNKFKEKQKDILQQLDNGSVVDKADAVLVSEKIIINKPGIENYRYLNGVKQLSVAIPEKIYTISVNPDSPQYISSTKYEDESIEEKANIKNAIEKYSDVESLAYTIPDRTM